MNEILYKQDYSWVCPHHKLIDNFIVPDDTEYNFIDRVYEDVFYSDGTYAGQGQRGYREYTVKYTSQDWIDNVHNNDDNGPIYSLGKYTSMILIYNYTPYVAFYKKDTHISYALYNSRFISMIDPTAYVIDSGMEKYFCHQLTGCDYTIIDANMLFTYDDNLLKSKIDDLQKSRFIGPVTIDTKYKSYMFHIRRQRNYYNRSKDKIKFMTDLIFKQCNNIKLWD